MTFVLHPSVSLAWCFESEHTPALLALLDRTAHTGATAPLLWPLDMAHALLAAERHHRLAPEKRAHIAALLQDLPITLDPETPDHAWAATSRLAERFALPLHHAAYLELAARRRLPLATLHAPLAAATAALGLERLGT
jgi:predicted nucleic acid-binding protein